MSKTLDLMLDVKNDVSNFEPGVHVVDVYTKATMLSTIASISDPLGMKIMWKQALPG